MHLFVTIYFQFCNVYYTWIFFLILSICEDTKIFFEGGKL